jgi:adenine-specific DNA-methyltransferase
LQEQNIKEERTAEDLLFQVLLDWGVDLTLPITREVIKGKTVYFVDEDTLVACFDNGLDAEFAKEIAKRKPLRAVFKESGYKQDEDKINIDQVILQFSPDTEVRAI